MSTSSLAFTNVLASVCFGGTFSDPTFDVGTCLTLLVVLEAVEDGWTCGAGIDRGAACGGGVGAGVVFDLPIRRAAMLAITSLSPLALANGIAMVMKFR